MTSDKRFPILLGYQATKCPCPSWIPWEAIAPYEGQAKANHGGQSLERLAERGGLSPTEAFLVMQGRSWNRVVFTEELAKEACAFLDKIVRDREQLRADHDRYKAALEKILNIRVQDKQITDAWKEARQIAFDAFDSKET